VGRTPPGASQDYSARAVDEPNPAAMPYKRAVATYRKQQSRSAFEGARKPIIPIITNTPANAVIFAAQIFDDTGPFSFQ